ncbi:MAG: nicotinamide riboside transporter PnuC [Flavobacteriales bacterium]|nr:MAG: nicotinamide riboside transporter PnuC [Flavobacteriales bacterium]
MNTRLSRPLDPLSPTPTTLAWTAIEAAAAAGNLTYTVLMLYERRVGWLFGIVASALGVALFLHQQVYAQVALNAFYVGMGVYGWRTWGRSSSDALPITRRKPRFHLGIVALGALLTLCLALALRLLPDARLTGLDGFATAFSLLATWMLARKILENWAYWIAADAVAIALYALLGMWWYAALYIIYVGLSISALVRWHRTWKAAQG